MRQRLRERAYCIVAGASLAVFYVHVFAKSSIVLNLMRRNLLNLITSTQKLLC
ncbi:hypothetical protein UNSWCD_1002 [Campylobacter concisus UNSWCD]|nr:hypothetical protein UNSWCD_1002 [Campylobacter concisus UNSWCD]